MNIEDCERAINHKIFDASIMMEFGFCVDFDVLKFRLGKFKHDLVILQKPLDEIHKKDLELICIYICSCHCRNS